MTWTVQDLADHLTRLAAYDPTIPVYAWNPEWIEAYSIFGLDIVDGKVYLHGGQGPKRDDPDGSTVPVGGE